MWGKAGFGERKFQHLIKGQVILPTFLASLKVSHCSFFKFLSINLSYNASQLQLPLPPLLHVSPFWPFSQIYPLPYIPLEKGRSRDIDQTLHNKAAVRPDINPQIKAGWGNSGGETGSQEQTKESDTPLFHYEVFSQNTKAATMTYMQRT